MDACLPPYLGLDTDDQLIGSAVQVSTKLVLVQVARYMPAAGKNIPRYCPWYVALKRNDILPELMTMQPL